MNYPCLIPKQLCQTEISMEIDQEGLNDYGEPLETVSYKGRCNYQDKAKTIYTDQKKQVLITGKALIPGDICPELSTISGGHAIVFGEKRRIAQGTKARNPNGSVNFTEVYLE